MTDDKVFGGVYAGMYDALYRDKNYAGECDLLQRAFGEYAAAPVRSVLDLGCGTGGHALPLAERGFAVTGVERSEGMLAAARAKAATAAENFKAATAAESARPTFVQGDVRRFDLGRRFDAAIMMFAVLGYQHENEDLMSTLTHVRRHLVDGGLFVFDVWYGPAVLTDPPGARVRNIQEDGARIIRTTETALDVRRQRCRVRFGVMRIEDGRVVAEEEEDHFMRFFFPLELELALAQAGMRLETLRVFPDFDREPDAGSWNVIAVARAVA